MNRWLIRGGHPITMVSNRSAPISRRRRAEPIAHERLMQ